MIGGGPAGMILPLLGMGVLGWLVPRLLGRVWPEGVVPLLLLALVATLLLILLSALLFLLLYRWQGAPVGALLSEGVAAGAAYFLRLGVLSALAWAPVMVLSVAGLPKHWKHETW
jgi:hypothetical protein